MADSGAPSYRPARAADLTPCGGVWRASIADYLGRLNIPFEQADLEPLRRILGHFLVTDPDRFWVATRPGRTGRDRDRVRPGEGGGDGDCIVGFGSAHLRGPTWFLAMLFVDPVEQAAGIGRALLERTLDGADGRILGTATDSAQPISNALYAGLGIVPRMPCLNLVGRPDEPGALPALPAGIRPALFAEVAGDGGADAPGAAALAASIEAVDREVVGYERPADHAWLLDDRRIGWLYRDASGGVVGYGYVSRIGRIGPVAAIEPSLLPPIVGHLLDAYIPPGASSLWVPGQAGDVVRSLIRAGLRLEPFPALLCWTEPIAAFDRYLPISLAIV